MPRHSGLNGGMSWAGYEDVESAEKYWSEHCWSMIGTPGSMNCILFRRTLEPALESPKSTHSNGHTRGIPPTPGVCVWPPLCAS